MYNGIIIPIELCVGFHKDVSVLVGGRKDGFD